MQELLSQTGLAREKLSLDALHLCPETVKQIAESGGVYLIGLKENQPHLLTQMQEAAERLAASSSYSQVEKAHGRVEQGSYTSYPIQEEPVDQRWKEAGFATLLQVERSRYDCKSGQQTTQTCFYLSNQAVKNTTDTQLAQAVRAHWQVETNNHIRDCTLREDKLKTIKIKVTKVIATCRTLVINLLNRLNPKNKVAQLELFADDFDYLIKWLKQVNLL